MPKTLQTFLSFRPVAWLLLLLVSDACQWNLDTREFEKCTSPTATIGYQATLLDVTFDLTEPTGTINNVLWDFGDGQTASLTADALVKHTYKESKSYTINAKLTNLCGDEYDAVARTITITNVVPATVTIQESTSLTSTTALLRMTVTSNGNGVISRYGLCYSATDTIPAVGLPNSYTVGARANPTVGTVNSFSASQLLPNTTYYVRAFAVNNAGTIPAYSGVQSFTTSVQSPTVVTVGTNSTNRNTATVLFRADNLGSPPATRFGICYSATREEPEVGTDPTTDLTSPLVGIQQPVVLINLTPNTPYRYRAFAVVPGYPPVYGITQSFKTIIEDLATDLVLNIPFDNQNASDISGNGNNATLIGNPEFTSNRDGTLLSALNFDGVDDYIVIPDKASQFTDKFTISCWIRPSAKALQARMQVFMKNQFSDGTKEEYSALIKPVPTGSSGSRPYANFDVKQLGNCAVAGDTGWRNIEVSDLILVNDWQHMVYVYDGKTMKEYHNGLPVRSKSGLPQAFLDSCPGGQLRFGVQSQLTPDYFQGVMDDIRIYKRALTDAEVSALYR